MQSLFEFKKRVLFVGMPDLALVCLSYLWEGGVNIVGVVPPLKSNPSYKIMMNLCDTLGLKVFEFHKSLDEPEFLAELKLLNADIAVVCSYDKLIPKAVLQTTKDGFLNVHPSLLPEYRGANPYSHVIINGETKSGVTIHYMDETFDTGDIVYQEEFPVAENETMGTLFNKTNFMSSKMLLEVLKFYEENGTLPRLKQPKGEFKTAPKIDSALRNNVINWEKSAVEIERFIRGLNPFVGAFTLYNGIYLKIHAAKVLKESYEVKPGTIVETEGRLVIACRVGSLELSVLQFGSYIVTDAKDFVTRFSPQKGESFNYDQTNE